MRSSATETDSTITEAGLQWCAKNHSLPKTGLVLVNRSRSYCLWTEIFNHCSDAFRTGMVNLT
jgi:hypothetical protein